MKKNIITLAIAAGLAAATFAQTPHQTILLHGGTPVKVRTAHDVSSNDASPTLSAIVESDIYDNKGENLLVAKDTPVSISIEHKPAKRMGRPGLISIIEATTYTADGQAVRLFCDNADFKGKDKQNLAHGLSWGLLMATTVSPLFLLIKGGEAKIPAGTLLPYMHVADNVRVEVGE